MGNRGPSPTPTKVLEARGSWRAKGREGEPRPPVERPSCPAWLKGEAKLEWGRQTAQLERMGLLAKADRALLAAYCEAWAEFVALAAVIAEKVEHLGSLGYTSAVAEGLINAKAKSVDRLVKLADRFGFSPAARTRVRAAEEMGKDSGKGRFFGVVS